mmetsp:Transcript_58169/g.65111  ORF Transcript_58169/g.65111 Transcript_58169/m.65111 type:complete len:663 (+) Transcript_58169:162-2150(+)
MASTNIAVTGLPIAELNQLHWVRIVPKVSLARSSSSLALEDDSGPISTSVIDHQLWWPCLIFNEYADFQDFFEDELALSDNHDDDIIASTSKKNEDALEARKLILSRIFTIMLQRKPVMVARLLGRPIQDYMEILPFQEEDEEEDTPRSVQTLESHQATHYVPFTALPSQESLQQMEPGAFSVVVSNENGNSNDDDDATTIIDEKLYMNYMLALDMARTQRMSGIIAPNKTLQSDFRDIGRVELDKFLSPPSIQDLSGTALAITTTPSVANNHDGEMEENSEKDNSDCDDSESCDGNNEDQAAVDNDIAQKGLVTAVAVEAKALETKDLQDTDGDAAAALPKENVAPEPSQEALTMNRTNAEPKCGPALSTASTPTHRTNDDAGDSGKKPRFEEEEYEEQNEHKSDDSATDESYLFSPSATVVTVSSEGSCTSPSSHEIDSNKDDEDDDEDPKICSDDTLDDVHRKLEFIGWTIDVYGDLYLTPKVGFDDVKSNPRGKGTDYFLTKEGFHLFLKEKYGWEKKRVATRSLITPKKLGITRKQKGVTVTPMSPDRPKRNRRKPGSNGGDDVESPKKKRKKLVFSTEDEEAFYAFQSLMKKLVSRLDWKYLQGVGLHPYEYVFPNCKSGKQGGTYLNDFFCEETEVIEFCLAKNYYARRHELNLV